MKKTGPPTGRPSLFRGKNRSHLVSAFLTPDGWRAFYAAQKRLATLATLYMVEGKRWRQADVSHGDTIEYLALGHDKVEVMFRQRAAAA